MLSKSSKVTIENQVREEVILVWIWNSWNPNFGDKFFVNQVSSVWTMTNAVALQLDTKQEIR